MADKLYKIKPLEWRTIHNEGDYCSEWNADTIVGNYGIAGDDHITEFWFKAKGQEDDIVMICSNPADGKAQAQKHFEQAMQAGLVEHVCEWKLHGDETFGVMEWRSQCGRTLTRMAGDTAFQALRDYCYSCGGKIISSQEDE